MAKKFNNFVTNNEFGAKSKTTTTSKHKIKHKNLARAGIRTGDLLHSRRMRYLWTTEFNIILSIVKLFNCLNAMGRNVKINKTELARHTISTK